MFWLRSITLVTTAIAVLADDVIVLKQGSLRGHRLRTRKGREIFAFQGIPYAKPPVGDLRFQAPQPPEPWEGILDATKEGSICVQRGMFPTETELRGREDCLFINVYTPRLPASDEEMASLDILFWIHGGGWYSGSGDTDLYGPQYLLDKDVILVTSNYRLGALGFLSTGDSVCPGNNALKDHVAALRWVRDNIAAFGGNPNSVTIFGESAGSGSVHHLMLSPVSKGLFNRAISQSGTAVCGWGFASRGTTKHLTEKVATLLNCTTQSSEELISCLRKKDAYDIFASDSLMLDHASIVPFPPVIESEVDKGEEAFITEFPMQTLLSGNLELVPWMVGITANEGALNPTMLLVEKENEYKIEESLLTVLLNGSEDEEELDDLAKKLQQFYLGDKPLSPESVTELEKMATDSLIFIGTNTAVRLHAKRNATTYFFCLGYRGSRSFSTVFANTTEDYGVSHLDDILYLFPQDHTFPDTEMTPQDEYMVDLMTTLWVNFARGGIPAPSWLPVSSHDVPEYALIDSDGLQMNEGLYNERAEFWDSLSVNISYPNTPNKDEL